MLIDNSKTFKVLKNNEGNQWASSMHLHLQKHQKKKEVKFIDIKTTSYLNIQHDKYT